jgi:hypothetical protein
MATWVWALLSAGVCTSAACGTPGDLTPIRTVVDSGGVELVIFQIDERATSDLWTALEPPELSIGTVAGGQPSELHKVQAARQLSDDRIVVANEGTYELTFFASDGTALGSVGREGAGPGEFGSMDHLDAIAGDSLVVHDLGNMRLMVFGPFGAFVRTTRFPGPGAPAFQVVGGMTGDGHVVSWSIMNAPDEQQGVYAMEETVCITSAAGDTTRAFAKLWNSEEALFMYRGRFARAFRPFGRKGDVAAAGKHIYVLQSNADREISVYDSTGRLLRVIRVEIPAQTADPGLVKEWVESVVRRYSDGNPAVEAWWRAGFEATPPPATVPVFRSLETDDGGNICAERYQLLVDAPSEYWCFSPEGQLLRRVRLAPGLVREIHPFQEPQLQIGPQFVLGVWQDSLGVQSVRRYQLAQQR